MTVAELVGRTLAQLGVAQIFGVIGSGNFHVTNSLRSHGVPYIATRHEAGAITMADAFARTSGQLAVMTTHQGCGLTNAITGIGEAAKSRTPLLVLAADSAGSAVRSNFKIDQDSLIRSVGAISERVHSAQSAVADTVRAYRTAAQGRRTVVLNLPLDVQSQMVPANPQSTPPSIPELHSPRANKQAVLQLVNLLTRAERPVFIAGRGARNARETLIQLADQTGALLATSAVANGLFNGHPYNLGISGGFSSPLTAEIIAGADLVVGWGASMNMWTMRHGKMIGAGAKVVQIDSETAALGATVPLDLAVHGDVGETAADALALLKGEEPLQGYRRGDMHNKIAQRSRWNDMETENFSTESTIDPRLLSKLLDEMLPQERTVAVDSGNFVGYPSAYFRVPDHFGSCFTQSFQSVGLGLSTALGAAVARPDRLPVLGVGDGGFLMGIAELETAVRLRIPLVIVIYNDNAYGAEVHHFGREVDLSIVTFPDTDLAAIGRGFGATGVTVRRTDDLTAVQAWLDGPRTTPLVIDAKISSDGGAWWLEEAFAGH
ncbi:thiamine pyrophosphate-binding protein [Pseudarthrobacter sp. H3Y2-7]|uniref:thiamine pyrophosphate-binding protein n=1 Tax=Pseudarthrobacter naphthalenicus TaxID=3031328 RepID=UPI0023AEA58F|nr:thiamine pyrophosphate-binding protein [Pseudarthrobacter sp. H3Y2-7]MDE8669969.1 thiamine pyrophosphate-binding protein [Pseudarthrobacter sp. H3Y2-7]